MRFSIRKPQNELGSSWPAFFIGVFVAFGGVLFGYDTGTISGVLNMPFWIREFRTAGNEGITTSQTSLIVSILSAGTFFGALFAAPLSDLLGRRLALVLSAGVVFNLGVALQTAATAQPMFNAGRFFAGLGVGLISALVPLYQSETAPKWIRGSIVGTYQWAITIGLFVAAIVNNATKDRNDSGSYRIPIGLQFAWSLVLAGGMVFLPETPRYLIKKDQNEKASESLSRLRRLAPSHPQIQLELAEIRANHQYEMSLGNATYIDCFKGSIGKRLLTGCMLQALQQLTGVNFIFYYGTRYFTRAGFQNPFIIQVVTNTVNVLTTLPGLYAVETMGRRKLLLVGAVGMCVSQFIVAIVGTVSGTTNLPAQRAAIAFVCVYIFFFASSWGPSAWVVTGEIFPLSVRAKGLSMTTATNWLLNWAIAYSTPYLVDEGPGYANLQSRVFFLWGSFCIVCIFFVYGLIYETRGLTLEEVDELYRTIDRAWESPAFRPSVNFAGRNRELPETPEKDSKAMQVESADTTDEGLGT